MHFTLLLSDCTADMMAVQDISHYCASESLGSAVSLILSDILTINDIETGHRELQNLTTVFNVSDEYLTLDLFSWQPHFSAFRNSYENITQTTEFLWKSLLPRLPKSKCGNTSVKTGLVVLGGARLPDDVANVLQKGPKFSLEPKIPAHELLTLNRRIADKVEDEGRERCLLEGVDSLRRAVSKESTAPAGSTQGVVKYFQNNDLVLLQADKDGGFVVLPSGVYCEKALQAVKRTSHLGRRCPRR
ncbi:hypothetical protein HPB48_018865 [Haemaphysalis longicornis]|uniref:Uncharacterized protein n=1 Tax=Haemaphysalis longicornis TaxID=44386 RepID=A0A9J6G9D8_HAELO|nr:hypothetical protein HPB48_018865 [Haemaphysalis longicornis]